ncbi:MAG: mucoidy inhibitor MuiA family protein [Pirellulales bacterium]
MASRASSWIVATVFVLGGVAAARADDAQPAAASTELQGTVSAVTVYQGQALVTRLIDVPAATGLQELVVTDLPEYVLPQSIYAEPADGAEVRSVRYRVRPVREDVREEVRKLDEQIQTVQDQIDAVAAAQAVLDERLSYLANLENFTAMTAKTEMTEGVLNTATVTELSQFLFQQRDEVSTRKLENNLRLRDLNARIELLRRERETVSSGSAKAVREAVVFVNVPEGAAGQLRLRYLVNRATWTPSYAIRAAADESGVEVEYYANVEQMSGENWTDVDMTLSTASPSLVAKAPTLDPLAIALGPTEASSGPAQMGGQLDYKAAREVLSRRRQELSDIRNRAADLDDLSQIAAETNGDHFGANDSSSNGIVDAPQRTPASDRYFLPTERIGDLQRRSDVALNSVASQEQLLDLTSRDRLQDKMNGQADSTEGVSVSYHLPNLTSLPSRSDRQLIQIASVPLDGDFYRLATPVLTNYVYREAELVNDSQIVLLAGPVTTFVGDQFVGRGEIPTVAVGERFTVGLGIDAALRVTRELVDKKQQIQGGNRIVDFTYELAVENFGSEAVDVRLLDRLPTSKDSDVRITLVSTDQQVSEDAQYRASQFKEGIYRWDVTVPAQAVGLERFLAKYTMKLEYDKELQIASLPAER